MRAPVTALLALLVLAFVVLAWGSAMDRAAASVPPLERLVPEPLRASAHAASARMALQRRNAPAALVAAREAVIADPIDPEPVALLGAARLLAGDAAGADAAFRVAALFGWREPITQLYWLDTALRGGEWGLAAMRLDAILRQDPQHPLAGRLLSAFESRSEGRAALSARLSAQPIWLRHYLIPDDTLSADTLAVRAAVLAGLADQTGRLGCLTVRQLTSALFDRGLYDEAEGLWQAHCPGAGRIGTLADTDFTMLAKGDRPGPFGWRRMASGDVRITMTPRGAGEGFDPVFVNRGLAAKPVLSQPVRLTPGDTVRLSAAASGADRRPSRALGLALDCGSPRRPPLGDEARTVTVPDCPVQLLSVWVAANSDQVSLDSISVD